MSDDGSQSRSPTSFKEFPDGGSGDAMASALGRHGVAEFRDTIAWCALPATEPDERTILVEEQMRAPHGGLTSPSGRKRDRDRLGKAGPPRNDTYSESVGKDSVACDQGLQPRHCRRLDANDHKQRMPGKGRWVLPVERLSVGPRGCWWAAPAEHRLEPTATSLPSAA